MRLDCSLSVRIFTSNRLPVARRRLVPQASLALGRLNQGSLEGSNVNIVEAMVGMIETQRAYEMNSKVISTVDGMLQYLNNNI